MNGWEDVPEYEGLYQVSKNGQVYSLKSNKILKPFFRSKQPNKKYLSVDLYKNGKRKIARVHRIVAEVFIPNPKNLPLVNHKDGNKTNNHVDNLEWCTPSENTRHAVKMGLIKRKVQ